MTKNTITKLWPIYIGEFINPEHSEIKNGLIDFLIVGSARSLALFSWDFFDDDFAEIVGKKYLNINKNLPK